MQFESEILQACWFLAGPTACGKSELSIQLARSIDAEIVSLDSMAIYRGMDIGTAKPSAEMQRAVPHHMVDIIDPHTEFSVAEYVEAAEVVCRQILNRGRVPFFVGGTGLYLRSVLRGVFEGPPADWDFRRELEQNAAGREPDFLHQRLAQVDPESADNIHPNDVRRIVRALEVHHLIGKPLSKQQQQPPLPTELRPRHVYWLSPERADLYDRINRRVVSMIEDGLIEEVRSLLSAQRPMSRTARQALGYKEVIEHIEAGVALEDTIDCIQTRTRQFAKRQHTWFRNLDECEAIELHPSESTRDLCERLVSRQ